MTVKKNILIMSLSAKGGIKNKTASPKAKPPLCASHLALCASHSEMATEYIPYGMIYRKKTKQVKNKWDKRDKWDSGVSYPQSHAFYRDTRLLSQAGVDKQCLIPVPHLPKEVGLQVGQLNDC